MILERVLRERRIDTSRYVATTLAVFILTVGAGWVLVSESLFSSPNPSAKFAARENTIRCWSIVVVMGAMCQFALQKWGPGSVRTQSESHAIENTQASQKGLFRLLFENTLDGVVMIDSHGRVIRTNRQARSIFQSTEEDNCITDNIAAVRASRHREDAQMNQPPRSSGFSERFTLIRTDGSHFAADLTWVSCEDEKGKEITMIILRDISDRMQTESTLHKTEELCRKIITTVPDVIIRTDLEGNILFVNETSFPYLSYPPKETILGRNLLSFVAPEERDRALRNMSLMLEKPLGPHVYTLVFDEGVRLDCEVNGDILRGADGSPLGRVYIVRDISERKRADEQVRKSLTEKELLLKEIHHRVKNNMQVISSLLNLQAARVTDALLHDILVETQNRIRSMALIHELLYHDDAFGSVNFRTYCQALIERLISIRRIPLSRVDIQGESFTLGLDQAIPCGLILNELVTNAFKHAYPDGSPGLIRVQTGTHDQQGVITVSDDGVGLPLETNLADPVSFGMQIVISLTEQLGGTLTVTSDGGTTFTLEFPLAK